MLDGATTFELFTNGTWAFGKSKGAGVDFKPNSWHTLSYQIGSSYQAVVFDGKVLTNDTLVFRESDLNSSWKLKLVLTRFIDAEIDNFMVSSL